MPGTASDSSVAEGTANGQREGRNGKSSGQRAQDRERQRCEEENERKRKPKAGARQRKRRASALPRRAKHGGITRGGRTARLACR